MRGNIRIGTIIFLVILATFACIYDIQPIKTNFLNFNENISTKSYSITNYEAINTTINIFTNKIEVSQEEVLFFVFTVCCSHNNSRINSGSLSITDLQTDRTLIVPVYTGTYSNLYENISWSIYSSDLPFGWHTFQFNYTGFVDSTTNTEYLVCNKEIDILVMDSWIYSNGNPIVMNITFLSAKYIQGTQNFVEVSLTAFKSSYFRIKSYLTITDKETGLILGHRVFPENLSEYIITWQDICCVNITIPNFLSMGNHAIRVFYSGSAFVCDHKFSYKDSQLFISGGTYQLDLTLSSSIIERSNYFENNIADLTFNLNGSGLDNGFLQIILFHSTDYSIDKNIIYSGIGISYFTRKLLFSHSNSSVGDYIISANFTVFEDSFSESITIRVFDETIIDLHANYATVSPGDELFIYGWISEEDIPTNSVNGTVYFYFGNDSNLLSSIFCNSDGYFCYNWIVPENYIAQISNLYTSFFPISNYYTDAESEKIEISISRNVNIVAYCTSGDILSRGDILQFQVQVLDESNVISDGTLFLASKVLNDTLVMYLETIFLDELTIINWKIPLDFPVGITTFIIGYSGYECYQNATRLYNIRILANTNLLDVSINASDFTQGSTLEITGKLVDENNTSISDQLIEIWENQQLIGEIITNYSGHFFFLFIIHSDYPLGFHDWQVIYSGDNQYYTEISSLFTISFKVNPIISLTIPSDINAGEILSLNITGRIYSQISILWKENSWNSWIEIDLITLNSEGIGFVNINVPSDIFGLFELKIVDIESQEFTVAEFDIFTIPKISIVVNNDNINELLVGDTLFLTVNSTELFDIWFNGISIGSRLKGTKYYPIIINDKGLQNITIHSYDIFARYEEKELLLETYELIDYSIQIKNYPDFKESKPIFINCSFSSNLSGNIEGLPVIIIDSNTGMIICSTFTNTDGEALLQFSLACGNYSLVIITPNYFYYLAIEYNINISVKSQAKILFEQISAVTEEQITFEVLLTSYFDNPLVNESISLKIYDSKTDSWSILGVNTTNSLGKAYFKWIVSFIPGDYNILAEYNGSEIASGVQSTSILHIKEGEGPRVIYTNYEINNSAKMDSDKAVIVNFLVLIESKVSIKSVKAIINNSEYFMKLSVSDGTDKASDRYYYSLSLILPIGEYNWEIIAINSLNISSYWLKSINIEIIPENKPNYSFFFDIFLGLSFLSISFVFFEYKRRINQNV